MWNDMLNLGISAPEKIIRTVAVYLGLAILLRLAGKRDLAQLNTFDLVVVLLLSNVVQNAVIGNDLSLTGGLLGAAVLVGFNALVVRLSIRSERLNKLLEGSQTVLAYRGRWNTTALRHEGLRQADVEAALRRQNANSVEEVEKLTIEPGGAVVTTIVPELKSATKSDVAALSDQLRKEHAARIQNVEAKLDLILSRLPG